MDSWNEKCAVFGIWGHNQASTLSYFGLYAQQHRGQEGAGIISMNEKQMYAIKKLGLVSEVFNEDNLKTLKGNKAIGHTRYSTRGRSADPESLQPLTAALSGLPLALAHNGNLVNYNELKSKLIKEGCQFLSSSDTECFIHLIKKYEKDSKNLREAILKSIQRAEGAYSLVILTPNQLFAARDPYGFRPLVLGKKTEESGEESWLVASETCAFDLLGAKYIREILPGELVEINESGVHSSFNEQKKERKACIFEHVYFARPDSIVFGSNTYASRKKMGRNLALQHPVKADMVIPVPDSGVPSALGYSEASGIPFEMGIIRNHYIGRTFINPTSDIRNFKVKIKLNPLGELIRGKSIVVVDDSLVRGTTSKSIVQVLKQFGAKEVHLRIASPPIISPCYYGVDTPNKAGLISSQKSVAEIAEFVQADTLQFLSLENLLKSVDPENKGYCQSCFTGSYPTAIEEEGSATQVK